MEDVRKYDETDVMRLKDELAYLYGKRRAFLGLGLGFLFGGVLMVIIGIVLATSPSGNYLSLLIILGVLGFPIFVVGIVFLILRSALFNTRINNRRLLLRQYEYFKKKDSGK